MLNLEQAPTHIGRRIITEGTDGTGKSTVADMLAYQLRRNDIRTIRVDEPDSAVDERGTILVPAAAELRKIIKNGHISRTPDANVTLFTASRFANWATASLPALERGDWVVQARDSTSTEVYQGYTEGYGIEAVEAITRATLGERYMNPDFRIILDFDDAKEAERLARISNRGPLDEPDTFEMRDQQFQQRIRDGYRFIAKDRGIDTLLVEGNRQEVATAVWHRMLGKLGIQLTLYPWE